MRAVLLIEEMPTECIMCPFCRVYADNKATETHCIWMATTNEDGINTRAEWCPLKSLPEKKKHQEEIDYDYGYIDGWNDCLEELEK